MIVAFVCGNFKGDGGGYVMTDVGRGFGVGTLIPTHKSRDPLYTEFSREDRERQKAQQKGSKKRITI